MAGRPRQFETDGALEKARDLFWRQGYEATSVQQLLDCMGINRGSMYDTFGDKRALFMKAFEHYGNDVNARLVRALNEPGSSRGNLERVLREVLPEIIEESEKRGCRGCLITNTAVELAPHDEEVAALVQRLLTRTVNAFRRCLENGVRAGEFARNAHTGAQARHLTAVMQGLMVLGKAGLTGDFGRDVVDVTLAGLN